MEASASMPRAAQDARAGWILILLTATMGVNQLDRGIVAILLQSIKKEMHLSDTALGLLTGFGFSVVYVIASFPIGRMADRTNRINLISLGMVFYSALTLVMGMATSITQLILARSAVAIGEATGSGPSTSVIADLYPPKTRARAIGIWSSGTYIGLFVGLIAGGWLNQHYGWRVALGAIAIPGVLIAALLKLVGREPRRGQADDLASFEEPANIRAAIGQLLRNGNFMMALCAIVCAAFVNYSFTAWVPSYLARVQHLSPGAVGLASGFFRGFMGFGGALLGGFSAHFLAKDRLHLMGVIAAVSAFLICPSMLLFLYAPTQLLSFIGLGFGSMMIPVCQAPSITMVQTLVTPGNRSFAITTILSCSTLLGLGFGPLVTGYVSDLTAAHGAQSLVYGLLVPTFVPLLTGSFFLAAAARVASVKGAGR